MAPRKYPRDVWVLSPSFRPTQVTVVRKYGSFGRNSDYGDVTAKGKLYAPTAMFATKALAIESGRRVLGAQEVALALRSQRIAVRRKSLDDAEAKNG